MSLQQLLTALTDSSCAFLVACIFPALSSGNKTAFFGSMQSFKCYGTLASYCLIAPGVLDLHCDFKPGDGIVLTSQT